MATFDDMELEQKLVIYDKGFDQDYSSYGEYIARSGDVWSPRISNEEPLRIECSHFAECIREGKDAGVGRRERAARGARARGPAAVARRRARVLRPSDRAPGPAASDDGVVLPHDIEIGANVVIHAGVELGAGVRIQDARDRRQGAGACRSSRRPSCASRTPTVIGDGATIAAQAVVVAGASIGAGRVRRRPVARARARA